MKKAVTEPCLPLKMVGPMGACRGHITAFKESMVASTDDN